MKNLMILFCLFFLLPGCVNEGSQQTKDQKNGVKEISLEPGNRISDIIRSPVDADAPVDTVNVAKMTFENTRYDFGTIREGEIVTHVFKFTNTGKVPLMISDARSTCGCTVPSYPKEPIPPGKGGEISVRFDSKGKKDHQAKP